MKTLLLPRLFALACAILIIQISATPASAAMAGAGFIKSVDGKVLLATGTAPPMPAAANMIIHPGDVLTTSGNGKVGLIFLDDTVVSLGPNSEIVIEAFAFNPAEKQLSFIARLIKGTFSYISGTIGKLAPGKVKLTTPEATLGVRGTQLLVEVK